MSAGRWAKDAQVARTPWVVAIRAASSVWSFYPSRTEHLASIGDTLPDCPYATRAWWSGAYGANGRTVRAVHGLFGRCTERTTSERLRYAMSAYGPYAPVRRRVRTVRDGPPERQPGGARAVRTARAYRRCARAGVGGVTTQSSCREAEVSARTDDRRRTNRGVRSVRAALE